MATASLRALLSRVIDYAGLFPPAKLPLDRAIHAFAEYRDQPESWMLGRFIIPAARLGELDAFADLFRAGRLWTFSCLGRVGNTVAEFLQGLRDDLRDIAAFRDKFHDATVIDVLETPLPADVLGSGKEAPTRLLADSAALIEEMGPPVLKPFYETPLRPAWREEVDSVIDALGDDAFSSNPPRQRCQPAGFKLRTGGLKRAAFPSAEQVAHVIARTRTRRVALKFTAGLHHPAPYTDAIIQVMMHGFLNLFVAGTLASALEIGEDVVRRVVEELDMPMFQFDDRELRWDKHRVPLAQIHLARRDGVLSFGSCSFDEPRDDLRALGLI